MSEALFDQTMERVRETALLSSTLALLEWDERTGLPASAGSYRADQITFLSGMVHQRKTDPQLGESLAALADSSLAQDPESHRGSAIRQLYKDFRRCEKLPVDLVQAISKATVLGQQAWDSARNRDDWNAFEPHLEEILQLRRQEAELVREPGQSLYDALLDQYEEGARSDQLTSIFQELRDGLVRLVAQLRDAPHPPTGGSWEIPVDVDKQRAISRWVAGQVGYCFERGRLDETSHPFCTTLGPDDCRILTRYQREYFPSGFYGTLHEAGHGIYEQGLPTEWYGLAPGMAASLGVHESQSRLWENFVGRSEVFWRWALPEIAKVVGGDWRSLDPSELYRDANLVKPSLIRVEADEVTYNLHILIRFEIEQALIDGSLKVADAPDAWNEKYAHYLGITPPSAKDGILQDVHWSAGLMGYFPTYTLGNLYAAQLVSSAERELGPLASVIADGAFQPLRTWLQEQVYKHGFTMSPVKLIEQAAGTSLSAAPLLEYLEGKLLPIYDRS